MIHYHGGPITPTEAAVRIWTARHACVSFADQRQAALAFEVCQSVMLDNGAFSYWKAGEGKVPWGEYTAWVRAWARHPALDFVVIPDVIDGDEAENDALVKVWRSCRDIRPLGAPVWHLHESLERLTRLAGEWSRVALGSSGAFAEPESGPWWNRIGEAMDAVCDEEGRPMCRLHGLRMLSPTVFSHLPLASADSTNVARNISLDKAWKGPYRPITDGMRALVLAERIEHHVAAVRWNRSTHGTQHNFELVG